MRPTAPRHGRFRGGTMAQTEIQPGQPGPADGALAPPAPGAAEAAPASRISPRICEIAFAVLLLLLVLRPATLLNSDGDTAQHLAVGRVHPGPRSRAAGRRLQPCPRRASRFSNWEWLLRKPSWRVGRASGLERRGDSGRYADRGHSVRPLPLDDGVRRAPRARCFASGILAAVASEIHWLARPHLFTFLLSRWSSGSLRHIAWAGPRP